MWTLKSVLGCALKLLHPFMPFITEEIYCTLNPDRETIMTEDWPEKCEAWAFDKEGEEIERIKEAVRGIRNVRLNMNVPPSKKANVYVVSADEKVRNSFEDGKVFFATLARAEEIYVQSDKSGIDEKAVSAIISGAEIYIPLDQLVDIEKEKERLNAEKQRLEKEVARCEGMLGNEKFVSKAPEDKVKAERDKLEKYKQMMAQVEERLGQLC